MRKGFLSFQQKVLYITIISSFSGTLWISFSIGSFHMFPYRFLLIFLWFQFIETVILNRGRIALSGIKVQIYIQFFILWFLYALLSLAWVMARDAAIKNITFLFLGISVAFFIIFYFREIENLRLFFWLWLIILIIMIGIGIWEMTTGNHLSISGIYGVKILRYKFAPTAVFYNQNDFGFFIVLSIPMLLVSIRYCQRQIIRVLGLLAFLGSLWVLICTWSRSCYLAVIMSLLYWYFFLLKWKARFKTAVIIVMTGMLLVVLFPAKTQDIVNKMKNRFVSLTSIFDKNGAMESAEVRRNLFKNAIYFTYNSAGVGVGAGNIEYYMEKYKKYPVADITNVHNWWIEILANYGVGIFVGYVFLYIGIFVNLIRIYKKLKDRTEIMIGESLIIGWIGFLSASVSSSSIIAFPHQWIFLGFVLAFINYWRNKNSLGKNVCTF